jgi:hypothetical protein
MTYTNKYRAIKTTVDGIRFDSKGEARRYGELRLMERAGVISKLTLQPRFLLQEAFTDSEGKRHRKIEYVADFEYMEDGRDVVEDFKGVETPVFKLKRKMLLKAHTDIVFRVTR